MFLSRWLHSRPLGFLPQSQSARLKNRTLAHRIWLLESRKQASDELNLSSVNSLSSNPTSHSALTTPQAWVTSLRFRLSRMPTNEDLIAASVRIRYHPTRVKRKAEENCKMNLEEFPAEWIPPLRLELKPTWWFDEAEKRGHMELKEEYEEMTPSEESWKATTFEADMTEPLEGESSHLTSGWFSLPLPAGLLRHLTRASRSGKTGRRVGLLRLQLVVRASNVSNRPGCLRSTGITPPEFGLQLRPSRSSDGPVVDWNWLHEAPHLLTFHRDQVLAVYLRRHGQARPNFSSWVKKSDQTEVGISLIFN
ncbi:unnamed protein product [Protopolystoma xenopodis]|uniref:Uncharacterized protein n=1 Tax=Protopolystoma xenopodis TaxID=117903 RepID=A0A448XEI6_9PLAT|nr:unnamed protein product [Protopolystoma xenopodis]